MLTRGRTSLHAEGTKAADSSFDPVLSATSDRIYSAPLHLVSVDAAVLLFLEVEDSCLSYF